MKHTDLKQNSLEQKMAVENCLFFFRVGSVMYGTNIPGKSDSDFVGVFMPNEEYFFGLKNIEQVEFRTNDTGSGKKNTAEDMDCTLYSLPKYIQLLLNNNPNTLETLFVPENCKLYVHPLAHKLFDAKELFLSKRSYHSFKGYSHSQIERLKRGEDNGSGRQELIQKFGFDCYHKDTLFLTNNGWKKYEQVKSTDKLATLNKKKENIEFQNYQDKTKYLYNGDMYLLETHFSKCIITPNHKLLISEVHRHPSNNYSIEYDKNNSNWFLKSIEELDNSKRSFYHIHTSVINKNDDYEISDDYLKVLGCFASEGTFNFRNKKIKSVRISQTINGKSEFFKIMRDLKSFNFKEYEYKRSDNGRIETLWISHDKRLCDKLHKECGHGSKYKTLPDYIYNLSTRQSNILLNALCLGDGTKNIHDSTIYYTSSKELSEKVQMLAIMSGHSSNIMGPYENISNFTKEKSKMYQVLIKEDKKYQAVQISTKNNSNKTLIKKIKYNNYVVCFKVKNETLITSLDGKISIQGNCKMASHALRLYLECNELLSTGTITLPLKENQLVLTVKKGEWGKERFIEEATRLETLCDELYVKTELPHDPDREGAHKLLVEMVKEYHGFGTSKPKRTFKQVLARFLRSIANHVE